jgi:hypothetical protein
MLNLKDVFDQHFKDVRFNDKLGKKVYKYQVGYVNSNHEHLQFFGSNLLGVHVIRFKDSDVFRWFDEVLHVEFDSLTRDVRKVDTIDHSYKVSGDILNLTLMYVIHRFLTSNEMDNSHRERAAYDTALVFFYRCAAAILSDWFKYPADPKIAQAAYSNLSNKFLIKKLGSWHKVMDYRALDLIDKKSIHYRELLKFTEDGKTVYAINDAQGRIRDLLKNYYTSFENVRVTGGGISSTSSTYIDASGEETTKDKTKSVEAYVSYMRNSLNDKNTFIKDELINVVLKINSNTSFRIVKNTLLWISENNSDIKFVKLIDEFVSLTIVQSMYMIENNMSVKQTRDYPLILVNLKNLYLSTRTTDPEVDKIRELGLTIVKKANGSNISDALMLSTRTGIILYLSLRALVGQNTNN